MFKDLAKVVTEFGTSLTYLLESQTRVDSCKKYGGPNLVTQYIKYIFFRGSVATDG